MTKTYIILLSIVVVVLGVYFTTPFRFFTDTVFGPIEEGVVQANAIVAYDDKFDGGSSEIRFRQGESIDFQCTLGADESKGAWCGLLFDMVQSDTIYRDWSFVDSVIVNLQSSGTDEILLKIWTFDPEVTDVKVPRTFRLLMKELPLNGTSQRISIPLEQFYTPDFWYDDAKVSHEMDGRHHETVARVEIAPGWNQPRGKKFTLKVESIQVKGLSNKTFGVVLLVMLVLTIVAIGRKHAYEKVQDDEKDEGK